MTIISAYFFQRNYTLPCKCPKLFLLWLSKSIIKLRSLDYEVYVVFPVLFWPPWNRGQQIFTQIKFGPPTVFVTQPHPVSYILSIAAFTTTVELVIATQTAWPTKSEIFTNICPLKKKFANPHLLIALYIRGQREYLTSYNQFWIFFKLNSFLCTYIIGQKI